VKKFNKKKHYTHGNTAMIIIIKLELEEKTQKESMKKVQNSTTT